MEKLTTKNDDYGIGHRCLFGDEKIGVRTTTMQRLVREGRSMVLLVPLCVHAACKRLENIAIIAFLVAIAHGPLKVFGPPVAA